MKNLPKLVVPFTIKDSFEKQLASLTAGVVITCVTLVVASVVNEFLEGGSDLYIDFKNK